VSVLDVSLNNSDTAAEKNLFNSQLNIDVGIIQCTRVGKDPAIVGADPSSSSSSGSNRTRQILVTVLTADQAYEVVASAKKLRKSTDPTIHNGVYINQFMSRIGAELAYVEQYKRRLKPNRTSATAANNNINNHKNNNKTSSTIVETNSSSPMQQATQHDVMSSLNPEASYVCPTPGVEQASNLGPKN